MTECYLFDIDGTLADCGHRLHHIQNKPKNWPAFFADCANDVPHEHICGLARHLGSCAAIVYVSGRSDECRDATQRWLETHDLPGGPLYMRKAGDHRDDDVVKGELLDRVLTDGYAPIMAFDDRNRVVTMWRARGVPCAQVAEGDF